MSESKFPPHEKMMAEKMRLTLDEDQLTNCMRCGFCLPACPTFQVTGLEAASPRGRIALMKAVYDGLISPDQDFQDQMALCLGCRACETACPAGVTYGRLLEQTRTAIVEHRSQSTIEKGVRRFVLNGMIAQPRRLRKSMKLVRFYQRSGLNRIARKLQLTSILPAHLQQMEKRLPSIDTGGSFQRIDFPLTPKEKPVARVGMFFGCLMDVMFTATNLNTMKLLVAAGYEVVISTSQQCCGAIHAHSGEEEIAVKLAQQNIEAFRDMNVDYIVSNAGGCGAQLIEYSHLLRNNPEYSDDARRFAEKVKDVSQLLINRIDYLSFHAPKPIRVTYQDSCHLRNGMKVIQEPRTLLRSIPNVEMVELEEADQCCGSAGTYNLVQPDMSMQILDRKMEHVKQTRADIIITSNPGCQLQMDLGVGRARRDGQMRVMHLIDFLSEMLFSSK